MQQRERERKRRKRTFKEHIIKSAKLENVYALRDPFFFFYFGCIFLVVASLAHQYTDIYEGKLCVDDGERE